MTSGFVSRRLALLAALASSALLFGCGGGGGGGDSGNTNVRAINLTTDVASLDIYANDTKQFSAVATDQLTDSSTLVANTYTLSVKKAGDNASLFSGQYSVAKDQHYTTIVWGREAALRVTTLPEDDNASNISSGTMLRVFNATIDSGSLDVFVTSTGADLSDTAPTQGALTSGTLAGFRSLSSGTYRLRVTGAGDPTDVRLDIPNLTLAEKQYATLVLTATGTSGVLLNGTLIAEQGAKTSMKNTKARVRLAASMANAGVVTVAVNNNNVFSAYRSPRVSAGYALVDSGAQNVAVTVNNAPLASNGTMTFAAGADYTLLVYGREGQGRTSLITDDNRVPSTTTRAKLRLVNGLINSDLLTLSLDFQNFVATSDIGPGQASGYATPTVAGTSQIEINSPSVLQPLYSISAASNSTTLLLSQGVYTVFMLDGQSAPAGRFVKDR